MKRRGPLVAALVSVAVIVLAVAVLILPKAAQVRTKQREVAEAKAQQSKLELSLQQLQANAKDAPKDRKRLAKLQAAIPPTADLPGLIRLLNGAASQSGVDWMSVSPAQPQLSPTGKVSVIPAQITITGGFFAIDQYLFRLENLPRAAKVISIQVTTGPDNWPQLQVSMNVEFYTTDTNAGPGSIPGPSTGTVPGLPAALPSPPVVVPSASPSPSVSP